MSKPINKKAWLLSGVAVVAVISCVILLNKSLDKKENQDTVLVVNDSVALLEYYKKEESKPCINPPLEKLNVAYTIYKVKAEQGGTFDFKTGSKIVVPKNAFVDESGKALQGEIELRYREFHDAIDFFVSGIPMTYNSAGVRYQFESAGMMEMLAYQDGKQVNMGDNKSINVELASNHSGKEYNLYKLDTLKNNWSCLGKDKVVESSIGKEKKLDAPKVSLEETSPYKILESKILTEEKSKEIKIAALPKSVAKPITPVEANNDKYTFNLEVDAGEFPELAVFKGLLFEVGPENKNFNKSMYDITWDQAIVKEGNKKGENYLLTLKKASKKYDLIVYPVFEGKNYEAALNDYQNKFNKYNIAFEKRKVDENNIEEEYQIKLAALKKQQKDLELKWKAEADREYTRMDTEQKVKRMFAINSFGVYNCDNPVAFPSGISCAVNLVNEKNDKILCYDVFLVDRAKNALFTYIKNPITKFSFNPKSANLLWTVENGVLYWLKPEQFEDINGAVAMSNLKMNRVDQKFKTVDELKAFFNF